MGLVQQEWVGQSRGKMPLPRFYWQPWERHLAAIHLLIAAGRRSHGGAAKLTRFLGPLIVTVPVEALETNRYK